MNTLFLKNITLVMLLFVASALVKANDDLPHFHIVNAGLGQQFGINVEGLASAQARFSVMTGTGDILLSQQINATDFKALYSLEDLPTDQYVFVLTTPEGEIRQPVQLTRRAILYQLSEREFTTPVLLAGHGER